MGNGADDAGLVNGIVSSIYPSASSAEDLVRTHFDQHQAAVAESLTRLHTRIVETSEVIVAALRAGKKLIAFGNGGSATQASHLAGELIGRFDRTRQPLRAMALAGDPGVVTCIANDFGYEALYERQCLALVDPGDVVVGLTTSGRSENVRRGLAGARSRGAVTILLTGDAAVDPELATWCLQVPHRSTAHVQEIHLMLIHIWCRSIDRAFA
ncbi:MAG TPA: SIS domain-containing protein [Acidobacteriaceae bacterium]|nr:SIS domain-containing protein [Acidobacteriaceae bacterium]